MDRPGEDAGLYDPRTGGEALRFTALCWEGAAFEPVRTNYFAVYRFASGTGTVAVDDGCHRFGPGSLLFVTPYQYLRFALDTRATGEVVEFHANFLCVETFHAESGCAGRLFNDPCGTPVLPLAGRAGTEVADLFARVGRECAERGLTARRRWRT